MSRGVAERGAEKRLREIPRHARPDGSATETDDVHVIVLDPLARGKVIVDQPGPDTRKLVGADRGAHTTAADGHAAVYRAGRHRPHAAAQPGAVSARTRRDRRRFPLFMVSSPR